MWKHVIYQPYLQTLTEIVAENTKDCFAVLRWGIQISPHEIVLVFGPPPIPTYMPPLQITSQPMVFQTPGYVATANS